MNHADFSKVRILIPTGFGLNCEAETAHAFRLLGGRPDLVHLTDLFAGRAQRSLRDYDVLALIGGFAYGDHIAGGFVLAARLRAHLLDDLRVFLERGGLVIGICNGFQTLVRLGLLPGPPRGPHDFVPRAALAPNDRLGYRDAWVRVGADPESPCVWTRGLGVIDIPARHGEGKLVFESDAAFESLARQGRVPLRYVDENGMPTETWPANPNGSIGGAAALSDASGRVFGLMPHPEAFVHPWQHPRSRHEEGRESGRAADGLAIFRAGLEAAAGR